MTDEAEGVRTKYPALDTWVDLWLLATLETPRDSETRWCELWWKHPEVVARLDAVWMAWEAARLGSAGDMSNWWTLHLGPHWRAITDPHGPLARCKHEDDGARHRRWSALPSQIGPAELFETTPVTRN